MEQTFQAFNSSEKKFCLRFISIILSFYFISFHNYVIYLVFKGVLFFYVLHVYTCKLYLLAMLYSMQFWCCVGSLINVQLSNFNKKTAENLCFRLCVYLRCEIGEARVQEHQAISVIDSRDCKGQTQQYVEVWQTAAAAISC